jgi:hypothetical protein
MSVVARRSRCNAGEPAHREPGQVDFVAVGPEGDVVAEPGRDLVAVGDAADPGEQRDVVEGDALGFVEADPLAEPRGDAPRAQDVFHRLAQTEVGTERERGD